MLKFFKKNTKDCLYIAVIIIVIFLYLLKPTKSNEVDKIKLEKEKLELQVKTIIDSLYSLNKKLQSSDSIKTTLETKYKLNKPKYVTIEKERILRDSLISTFDAYQLELFFTDRFNQSKIR